jgi:hypothetical protein
MRTKSENQPHAIAYALGIATPSQDKARQPVPVASDEKTDGAGCRREITGGTEGK